MIFSSKKEPVLALQPYVVCPLSLSLTHFMPLGATIAIRNHAKLTSIVGPMICIVCLVHELSPALQGAASLGLNCVESSRTWAALD